MTGLPRTTIALLRRLRRGSASALALLLALGGAMSAAQAADALNGKTLYLNGPVGGGASCASCHSASPANNVNGILVAANNPAAIQSAIATNAGGVMGVLFNGRFSQGELADLAAFIGNPNVTAAPVAALSPAALSFDSTTVGQTSAPLAVTLSNTGNAALAIGSIGIGGAAAGDFVLGGGSCSNGASLAAGASCTVQAAFRPTAAGARNASLSISHNATGGSSSAALSGTGNSVPQPSIALSATNIDFGQLLAGTPSAVQAVTVSNGGQAALHFSAISLGGANADIFSIGGSCATATPLAAGASCTVNVQAAPAAAGTFSATLTLASDAANSGNVVVGLAARAAVPAPALSASPSALGFGVQTIAAAAAQTVTLANSGNVAIAFSSVGLSGSDSYSIAANNCGTTLAVGASCTVQLRFAPKTAGSLAAALAVASNAAPLQVQLSGSGTAQPAGLPAMSEAGPVAFSDTQVGASSAPHVTTLANSGTAALQVATLTLGGAQPAEFVLGGTCTAGATVAPGASCTIESSFKPGAAGARSADLLLATDGGAQLHLALRGNGVAVINTAPALTVSPSSFDFGAVTVGDAVPVRRFTLANSGSVPVTLASAAFSGPYAAASDSSGCAAFPFTLQPGASCDLMVRYTPVNAGGNSGSVVLQSSVAGSSWTIALSGQASAGQAAAEPVNRGGGGCSAAAGTQDPVLALLVVLSALVLAWRSRRERAAKRGSHGAAQRSAL